MSGGFHCELKMVGLPRLQADVVTRYVRVRERKQWRDKTLWAIKEAGVKPPSVVLEHAQLVFTRHSTQAPDSDNLAASFKPIQDALIGILIQNDTPEVIGTPVYQWASAPPRGGYVTVEVTEGIATTCPACGQALPFA